ncbi:MAG TPA: hypothetical protein DEQ02_09940 [Ruminococcaceae bacterium]|nr:hypothetical protein [Oscillospiraceae bacterium]
MLIEVKNLLRLTGAYVRKSDVMRVGELLINLTSREVSAEGTRIKLAPREYDLLLFLACNPEQCFTREMLLDMIWGHQFDGGDRTVDTHIKSLRERIRPYNSYITMVWGYRYKFSVHFGN